jgi:hypothetical protein
MRTIMHLLPSLAKQLNLELKTRPKQLLGSLPLFIALPELTLVFLSLTSVHANFVKTFNVIVIFAIDQLGMMPTFQMVAALAAAITAILTITNLVQTRFCSGK